MTGRREGSVLVEALVATAIVALVLVGVLRTIEDSLMRHRIVEARRTALMIARSGLAEVGFSTPLAEGVVAGEENGYVWRIAVARCPDAASADSAAGRLYCVDVDVRAPGRDRAAVTLASRRLAAGV
ncbi:hypothetical protein [Caulobacter soli]|uniref:hypothetical protein n=1 Tax=Caulobacter soli TaxID=2708539 RepID=UPI0013ED7C7F|nr:hypothetical protein [Caulobacter soli]